MNQGWTVSVQDIEAWEAPASSGKYSGFWTTGPLLQLEKHMGNPFQSLPERGREQAEETVAPSAPAVSFPSQILLQVAAGLVVAAVVYSVFRLAISVFQYIIFRRSGRRRPKRSLDNELGSSDLAQADEFKRWLRTPEKLDTSLFIKNARGANWSVRSARICIPSDDRNKHMLIVGKTGGGKTTSGILPLLYQDCLCPVRSSIVIDSKSEMWHLLGQMTRKFNPEKQLLLFNPLDRVRSLSWNIVGKITTDAEAKLVATTIIAASDNPAAKADTPFFRNSALQLLNAIMVGLVTDPNDRLSMPRVHQLLNSGKQALCEWLLAHEEAALSSRTFVELAQSGSQNADTVLSELSMRLSAWDIAAVRATTFFDELDLDMVVNRASLLVVELRESELEMLRPMANTIVVEILRCLTRRAEMEQSHRLPRPVGLVIDEFASALGRLPDIHVKLNTLRSRNVSIVAAIQSIGQLRSAYSQEADNVIAGFGTKIFIPPLEQLDSEWASKESGTMTIRYNTASRNRSRKVLDTFALRDRGRQENVQQRAVLTPDEIGRAASKAATFFLPNLSAFQGHLMPYFEIQVMRERIGLKQEELSIRRTPLADPPKIALPPLPSMQSSEDESESGSHESVENVLGEMKPLMRWDDASEEAREWWGQLEGDNAEQISGLVMVAVELIRRGATLADLHSAYLETESDSMERLLEVIDERHHEPEPQRINENQVINDADRRRAAWQRLKRQRKNKRRRQALRYRNG